MGLEKHPVLVSKKLSGLGLGLEACGLDYNTGGSFNYELGQISTGNLKIGIQSFPAKRSVEQKPASLEVCLLYPKGKQFTGFPDLQLVDRWTSTAQINTNIAITKN